MSSACAAGYGWCKDEQIHADRTDGLRNYCVFHAPNEHKQLVFVEEFNQIVFSRLTRALKNKTECNLSGTIFPGDISFSDDRLPSVDFREAKFEQKTNFYKTRFTNKANFYKATFGGNADFREAKFAKVANFIEVTLGGIADFGKAKFDESARFNKATFGDNADFISAEFVKGASFKETEFSKNATFKRAKFGADVSFREAEFRETADFRKAEFTGRVDLGAKFKKAHFLKDTFIGLAELNGFTVDDEARFKGVDFRRVRLHGAELDRMRLEHCTWDDKTNKGHITIYDETKLHKDSTDKEIQQVEETYRTLKQRYKEMNNEGMAALFHVSEKRMLTRRMRPKGNFFYWLVLNSYRLSSGYGENPSRAFAVLIVAFAISMMAFGFVGIEQTKATENTETIRFINPAPPYQIINILTLTTATFEFLTLQRDPLYTIGANKPILRIIRDLAFLVVYTQTLLFLLTLRNRLRR